MYVCTTGGSGRRQRGGAERLLMDLIPALADRGVEVLACTSDDELGAALRDKGVPWIAMSARKRLDLGYARQIAAMVEQAKPDVVCAHLLSAAMHSRAAMTLGRRDTPLVVTLHNSLWQYRDAATGLGAKATVQSNIAIDALLRKLRPHASVAVSRFEAEELAQRGDPKRVHLIPNCLPESWPLPSPSRRGEAPPRVGFMGRLEVEKGADLIPAIAQRLPAYRFAVAGAGTVDVEPAQNIERVGYVDASTFLREIDCLIVPSRVESFGLSALEALSLGVPVVHSAAGGLAELTRPAEGVLAFRADTSPESIASAIQRAVSKPATDHTRAMARWYSTEYAFSRFVQRWHDLYRMVMEEKTLPLSR